MITLIKMKLMEWRLKLALYTAIETVIKEQKNITALLSNLYVAIKDVPLDDLKSEFITELAKITHAQVEAERQKNGTKED